MKQLILANLCALFFAITSFQATAQADVEMIFKEPAAHFTASAPLGNGRLGAMVFGNTNKERIALNEISLWSGGVEDANNYDAYKHLDSIRHLLLQGKNIEAQRLLQKYFICKGPGSGGDKYGCYQTLGDLFIHWKDTAEAVSDYRRSLRLDSAIATTTWKRNGITYTQQVIVSNPQQAIIIRLTSDKKGALSFNTGMIRKERGQVSISGDELEMKGTMDGGKGSDGVKYSARLKVLHTNGTLTTQDNKINVQNADECILVIVARTDMNWPNVTVRGKYPSVVSSTDMKAVASKQPGWTSLLTSHVKDFKSFFDRNRVYLGTADKSDVSSLSMEERLFRFKNGEPDPALIAMYFNFGRYLLISSSRPGTALPANLQGLWAEEYKTPWNADYHLNINVEMNYWLSESTNLSDCNQPYFRLIKQMSEYGKATAKAYYNSDGWVAHVIYNPWGFTAPGEGAGWGSTLTGGCWVTTHLWEHYLYTKDKKFLQEIYPIIKGSAQFYTNILIEEPKHHWLVTAPSNSPENSYVLPDGKSGQTCMGPTMDMQIGRQLLEAAIEASAILKTDEKWRNELISIRQRLAPNQISPATGALQEWLEDYKEAEPTHRHVSHLYGLHPYDEITPWSTPDLAAAAKKTLEKRGDGGTGWSRAWKIAFWARLADGDHAYTMLKQLLTPAFKKVEGNIYAGAGAGTYANLFCAHPPFQIDGNFGATAAIAEMLMQSHGKDNVIRMLPAWPNEPSLSSGKVTGLCARGGFEVSFDWKEGKVTQAVVVSKQGGICQIELPANAIIKDEKGKTISTKNVNGNIISFDSKVGGKYFISM